MKADHAEAAEDGTPLAHILEELVSLNDKVKHVLEGQAVIHSALHLTCLGCDSHKVPDDGDAPLRNGCSTFGRVENGDRTKPQHFEREVVRSTDVVGSATNCQVIGISLAKPIICQVEDQDAAGGVTSQSLRSNKSEMKRSRSSINALRTEDEDIAELRSLFAHAEEVHEERNLRPLPRHRRALNLSVDEKELCVDSVIGIIVCLNAVFIGFSMDADQEQQNLVMNIDICFSVVFLAELFFRIATRGFRGHFFGNGWQLNVFDAVLIAVDLFQLAILWFFPESFNAVENMSSVSLFRIVRLVRLARMLRVLRHECFETVLILVHGMVGSLSTLVWALLVFVITIYVVALLFREYMGRGKSTDAARYFGEVPRSMLTTFRCAFGDCTFENGYSISENIAKEYGAFASVAWCLFVFSMTVGVFNVISAIFVESTLESAQGVKFRQKKARLLDHTLWATKLHTLVLKLVELEHLESRFSDGFSLAEQIEDVYHMDVSRDTMNIVGRDPVAQAALADLDIDPEDHENLADILDPDQGGSIAIVELVEGISRLRGDPKRSDIVTCDLMLRSIQRTLQDIKNVLIPPER
eukprot:TRINITY_DN24324_c0_g1_i1.p1 TRINITY_DN24324_c0_g1~~TRINITY_DN24324_c0_g1_i1.p1  ORF type:complete len:583 (+),score=103.92 TRINITY_DN24324_c0_g1_i1:62-1810(+)